MKLRYFLDSDEDLGHGVEQAIALAKHNGLEVEIGESGVSVDGNAKLEDAVHGLISHFSKTYSSPEERLRELTTVHEDANVSETLRRRSEKIFFESGVHGNSAEQLSREDFAKKAVALAKHNGASIRTQTPGVHFGYFLTVNCGDTPQQVLNQWSRYEASSAKRHEEQAAKRSPTVGFTRQGR